ncbi:MAG: TlpA family protein disulfide reductase [Bacteroidales bacterium]|nr:TlpA family protein disulfide reductase [Bacteroidales bacterium]
MPFVLNGQNVQPIDKDGLVELLESKNKTTYVVNFWATWCAPCVSEIGYFESLHNVYGNKDVHVKLVNLDFPNQLESRVIPFIKENKITAEVLQMTDLDYNSWISEVDANWSGAIPATLIFKGNEKIFFEGELTREQLFENVNKIRNL